MARRTVPTAPPPDGAIIDVDVAEEMRGSYLEYAYSVIYSRALPDARDGLKPVHRRILYQMAEMGLRPDRGHVKSARVVGEVMGKLHPHGDSAIYDALVRMAQPFAMRVPLVDGHGNFGSLGGDDPPAAMRYTECRLAPAAQLMTTSLDEDVVDMVPNYDDHEREPAVLPAAFPNLLVNGTSGIAVGMATNMAPHNLREVVAAARHLLAHPRATLEALMRFVPGPDLPTGGRIVGLEGVRDAYRTGRGIFRTRATVDVTDVTARRKGLVVTELPYTIGPERVIAKIKELVQAKKLLGIADVKDLTDRTVGLRLVIEVKSGFHPEAVLAELYRLTPMEETFGVNNVALVEGQPRTLGLLELLRVYVEHRLEVVRRRSAYRRGKALERAHVVEGLLLALANIDEVVRVIRSSLDADEARDRLVSTFTLSQVQAGHILDMPLRRLVGLEVDKLERELAGLRTTIAELDAILASDELLRTLVSDELAEVAKTYGTPRRTVLLDSEGSSAALPLEVADDPCRVVFSSTGLLARTPSPGSAVPAVDAAAPGGRGRHDVVVAAVATTARGQVGVLTSSGRLLRLSVLDLPSLPPSASATTLSGGAPLGDLLSVSPRERAVAVVPLERGLALATAAGVVKRVQVDWPAKADAVEVIGLRAGDEVVGAGAVSGDEDLVLLTSDAHLLRTPASGVRPQGRAAGGMAGVALTPGATVIAFAVVDRSVGPLDAVVVTIAGSSGALPGTEAGTAKVTPLGAYPSKGRATGGVRCHRFLRGEDVLLAAWVGPAPARAASASGEPVPLPPPSNRRDDSGTPLAAPVNGIGTTG